MKCYGPYSGSDTLHKYFSLVWTVTFFSLYRISHMKKSLVDAAYDKAVVQAFVSTPNSIPCSGAPHVLLETNRRVK